jgi:hypothetical protein
MASTIKVDNVQNQPGTNIINKCSTTVTLGASGDNIALASGATQSGFGRTGTVDWVTTVKVTGDSPITGVTGKGYFMNTTAGAITINLPVGVAGSIVSMADYAGTWQTNNVIVAPNGSEKMGGIAEDSTLSTEGQSVTFVYIDSTQGWLNTMDSTSNVRGDPPYVAATGGTITTCGDYKYHKFTGPGCFTVTASGNACGSNTVSSLVVAGGAGGGSRSSGGGGAGGIRTNITSGTLSKTDYPITVGAGGAGAPDQPVTGSDGSSSTFAGPASVVGAGGGGGGSDGAATGQNGGSGGGGANNGAGGSGNTPPTTPVSQGNNGGPACSGYAGGGGGGGAGVGGAGSPGDGVGGCGGAGTDVTPTFPGPITGNSGVIAGGGGGGGNPATQPPSTVSGGGGVGGPTSSGANGTDNTGGGGGGSGGTASPSGSGGTGGSGLVIIKYKFQN